jgi:pimeloyl-ACP methyl ester carboxylesterase
MLRTGVEAHFGRQLRIARLGNGPPLILLHGYPDTLQVWHRLADQLKDSFQVIAFDWPGMGYSDPWPGGATPFHMADRVVTLLDLWKIKSAYIAGIDMGGQPAAALAIRHPARVRSLIVMNSLLQWNAATSWEIAILRRFKWNRFALQRFPGLVFNHAIRTFLPHGETLDDAVRSDMWECFKHPHIREYIVRMCAAFEGSLPQLAAEYSRLQVPTLLLWAEHDKHFPVQHAKSVELAAASVQVRIVPGAHHWMPLSMSSLIANYIRGFTQG